MHKVKTRFNIENAMKAQRVSEVSSLDIWPLKMGPIGTSETSVVNQPTLRNIPEDGRIQINCIDCLRSRTVQYV
jgi:hypothetical protein